MRRMLMLTMAVAAFPAPAVAAPSGDPAVHIVLPGETLNGIAHRAGVSAEALAAANKLSAPYILRSGQRLIVPVAATVTDKAPVPIVAPPPAPTRRAKSSKAATDSTHTVAAGETLSGIANRAGMAASLIAEANGLRPPYFVRVGQKLTIPRTRVHIVKAGESSFSIAYDFGVSWDQIATANRLDPAAPPHKGQKLLIPALINLQTSAPAATHVETPLVAPQKTARKLQATGADSTLKFTWPVRGKIRRGYRSGANYHDGLDIVAPEGTPVRASAGGTVLFAGPEKKYNQLGKLIVIDNGEKWLSAYAFLQKIEVKPGDTVTAGQSIGTVGHSGLAKGSELHFEIRHDGVPIDPLDALPKAP